MGLFNQARSKAANALYRSDQAHFYEVSWTNTITGSAMRTAFRSYDRETAHEAAVSLSEDVSNRNNYYEASPRITYLGIHKIDWYDGACETARPNFDCYW